MEKIEAEVKVQPGTACIKQQYISAERIRKLNYEFVATEDKNQVAKRRRTDDYKDESPKKKLRGQNKKRPRNLKVPKSEKLCFKFSTDGSCPYGTSCSYSHDIESYLAKKPSDIGENCYLFDTFGKCRYGFSCRFGSKHLINGQNLCNEDLYNKIKDKQTILNALPYELQISLRKRVYDFSKSNDILNIIQNGQWRKKFQNKVQDGSDADKKDVHGGSDTNTKDIKDGCDDKKVVQDSCDDKNCVLLEVSESIKEVLPSKIASDETSNNVSDVNMVEIESKKDLQESLQKPLGPSSDEDIIHLKPCEKKKVNFRDKLYLAPLTTVGNLPFRRICKEFGADITCGEMAVATSLLQAQHSEWALLKRHHTEDIFGVQICGSHADTMIRCTQVLNENTSIDFIDVNMGCPLDFLCYRGSGCGLMTKPRKLEDIIYGMSSVSDVPITLKMRTGISENEKLALNVIKRIHYLQDRISLLTIHGRSKEQRYTKSADWDYIELCNKASHPVPLFGNGDVLSYEDYNLHRKATSVQGIMIARGALLKPWIFTEIKEQRHWDISSSERFDFIKKYTNYGLEHWGSDSEGVEKTRRFLLEWLSFLYRYIPVGLLERVPQHINERPPPYFGRNDLETLMASASCADWIKISEMLLGPVPENFTFLPKHKANAYG